MKRLLYTLLLALYFPLTAMEKPQDPRDLKRKREEKSQENKPIKKAKVTKVASLFELAKGALPHRDEKLEESDLQSALLAESIPAPVLGALIDSISDAVIKNHENALLKMFNATIDRNGNPVPVYDPQIRNAIVRRFSALQTVDTIKQMAETEIVPPSLIVKYYDLLPEKDKSKLMNLKFVKSPCEQQCLEYAARMCLRAIREQLLGDKDEQQDGKTQTSSAILNGLEPSSTNLVQDIYNFLVKNNPHYIWDTNHIFQGYYPKDSNETITESLKQYYMKEEYLSSWPLMSRYLDCMFLQLRPRPIDAVAAIMGRAAMNSIISDYAQPYYEEAKQEKELREKQLQEDEELARSLQ